MRPGGDAIHCSPLDRRGLGAFPEQPGVAGDKYLSKMDSGGSSGVTSGALGGPFWRQFSWIKYMSGGIFVDCSS